MSGIGVRFPCQGRATGGARDGRQAIPVRRLRGKPVVIICRMSVEKSIVPTPRFPGFAAEANQTIMTERDGRQA